MARSHLDPLSLALSSSHPLRYDTSRHGRVSQVQPLLSFFSFVCLSFVSRSIVVLLLPLLSCSPSEVDYRLIAYGLYPDRPRLVSRAKSSNALAEMAAAVVQGPAARRSLDRNRDRPENSLSTLRDPRVASTSDLSRTRSASTAASHHPDLSNEVANLSDKLIQAINHQTFLDDSLAVARQELEEERRRRTTVEREKKGIETELENLTAALFEEANKVGLL